MADAMDKALQWDVERGEWTDERGEEFRRALAEAAVQVNVEFIGQDTLRQWRDISLDAIGAPPSVERLVRFLGRRLPDFKFDDDEAAARFAGEIPALLQRTWEHVGTDRIGEYLHGARTRARAAMKEYLS
jgi:hypothetical protein